MGLDMFLTKVKREEVAYWRKANAIHKWFSDKYAKMTGEEELENCQDFRVTKEDLIELRDTCQKVIDSSKITKKEVAIKAWDFDKQEYVTKHVTVDVMEDSSLAEELLPTQDGFFFGSQLYDEYYVEDLKETIDQIDKVLETVDFDEFDVVYSAWW